MQAIKCPNCGSEKCQELTEEKWVCLACDNVFLIHNLSKEFTKTDKHIAEVHSDLKEEIAKVASKSDNLETSFQSAMSLLAREEVEQAEEIFEELCHNYGNSYKGWYGKFQIEKDDSDPWMEEIISSVDNVLKSDDVPPEIRKEMQDYLVHLKETQLKAESERLKELEEEEQKINEKLNERNSEEAKEQESFQEKEIKRLENKVSVAGGFCKIIAVLLQIAIVLASIALAAGVVLALGGGIVTGFLALFQFLFGAFDRADGMLEWISCLFFGFIPRLAVVVFVLVVGVKLLGFIFRNLGGVFGKGKNIVKTIIRKFGNMKEVVSDFYRSRTGVDDIIFELESYRDKTEDIMDELDDVQTFLKNRREHYELTQLLDVHSIETFKEWASSWDRIDVDEYAMGLYATTRDLTYKLTWEDPSNREMYDELIELCEELNNIEWMSDETLEEYKIHFGAGLDEEYEEYEEEYEEDVE